MTADLTPEALAALDALAAAATPGPWGYPYPGKNLITTSVDIDVTEADWGGEHLRAYRLSCDGDRNAWRAQDAAYIAAADPSTVRALIAALTEARANIAHLRGMGREDTAWNEMKRRGDAAEARLAAVRALHQETFAYSNGGVRYSRNRCTCERAWPCATVRALDGTP